MRPLACVLALVLTACSGGQTASSDSGDGGTTGDASSDGTRQGDDAMVENDVVVAPDALADAGNAPDAPADVVSSNACGAPGQACCLGEACEGNGCCIDQVCVSNGVACGHGLGTCANGSCGSCGGLGQPCCPVDMSEGCSGPPDAGACGGCTQTGTMCFPNQLGGSCVACGMEGQQCCINDCIGQYAYCDSYFDDAGQAQYVCSSQCGGPGQPCCQDFACKNGGCCMQGTSGNGDTCVDSTTCGCTSGQCTTCGLLGQPCCAGDTCEVNQGQCLGGGDDDTCQQMHP
jgi:hypothetical protein